LVEISICWSIMAMLFPAVHVSGEARLSRLPTNRSPRSPDAAQRAVLHGVVRCRAGAVTDSVLRTVPALRSGMKDAAPRPGHGLGLELRRPEGHCLQHPQRRFLQ
jgi:hypothetical protein